MKKEIKEMKKQGWFPILKTGTFKDDQDREHTFTEKDLQAIASNYDRESENFKEAAITVGHPKNDSPAFGWVEELKAVGELLFAKAADVVPEFAEAVRKKMYKYISPAIRPDKTLKHVGFLGGQPPAIPGLGPVSEVFSFSEDDEAHEFSFDFAELDARRVQNLVYDLARVVQGIREFLIEKFSIEEADHAINKYDLQYMMRESVMKEDENKFANYSENKNKEVNMKTFSQDDLNNELSKKEKEVSAQFSEKVDSEKQRADNAEAELEKIRRKQKEDSVANFVEKMREAGKILPKNAEGVKQFMLKLDDTEALNFSEGSEKKTDMEFFKNLIEDLPNLIPLEKLKTKGEGGKDRSSDFAEAKVDDESMELHDKASALAKKEGISFEDAVERVR